MAIETLQSHVFYALNAKQDLANLWLSMGRTTAWQDESIPPAENMDTSHLDEITGFKRFDKAQLVAPLTADFDMSKVYGDAVIYKGQQWENVADEDAYKKGARYLYLEAQIEPEMLPYAVYRQIGVFRGLKPQSGWERATALYPQQVTDMGMLMGYDNRLSQRYANNVTIKEQIILEF